MQKKASRSLLSVHLIHFRFRERIKEEGGENVLLIKTVHCSDVVVDKNFCFRSLDVNCKSVL
jgi:hypothetical protein